MPVNRCVDNIFKGTISLPEPQMNLSFSYRQQKTGYYKRILYSLKKNKISLHVVLVIFPLAAGIPSVTENMLRLLSLTRECLHAYFMP